MDALVEQIAQGLVDQPLPLDARLAGKGGAFDHQAEMTFPGGIVTAVAAVRLAIVDQLDPAGRKRRVEPPEHFTRDRTGGWSVHRAYIGRLRK